MAVKRRREHMRYGPLFLQWLAECMARQQQLVECEKTDTRQKKKFESSLLKSRRAIISQEETGAAA